MNQIHLSISEWSLLTDIFNDTLFGHMEGQKLDK